MNGAVVDFGRIDTDILNIQTDIIGLRREDQRIIGSNVRRDADIANLQHRENRCNRVVSGLFALVQVQTYMNIAPPNGRPAIQAGDICYLCLGDYFQFNLPVSYFDCGHHLCQLCAVEQVYNGVTRCGICRMQTEMTGTGCFDNFGAPPRL